MNNGARLPRKASAGLGHVEILVRELTELPGVPLSIEDRNPPALSAHSAQAGTRSSRGLLFGRILSPR